MRLRATGALLSVVIAAVAVAAGAASAEPEASGPSRFSDVDASAYYSEAIAWARDAGVVTGYTDACFVPDDSATRGEVMAVIHRALEEPPTSGSHPFTDVTVEWQQAPLDWAAENGITHGTGPTTFNPGRAATRAHVAIYLWRASGRPAAEPSRFVDVTQRWQISPVGWMVAEGITAGRSATRFDPEADVTRGELVTFVWRWLGSPAGPADLDDGPVVNCDVDIGRCSTLFDEAFVDEIAAAHPGARFTAAVHDHRTGCAYRLNPGLAITTASVIKAQVLAGVLLAAQDAGRPLTESEAADVELMMHYSHNTPPTSRLYVAIGGAPGMEALDERFGIAGTSHTARYGATLSTAEDRTVLVEQLLIGGGPLDPAFVGVAWDWMSAVSAAQRWGVTAGLPAGYAAALKNGFYPLRGGGWRLGTTGAVRDPSGGAYAMTVMTDGNPNESAGIALVEAITRHINSALTAGPAAARPVDAVTCVEPPPGSSWSSVAATLGQIDAATLRFLNGGEAAPLAGQRICRP